jgi:hypothetical protein
VSARVASTAYMAIVLLAQLEIRELIDNIVLYKDQKFNDLANCFFNVIICRVECDPKTQLITGK